MTLEKLLEGIKYESELDSSFEVFSIAYDSRKVEKGGVFVCIPGFTMDGHGFIKNAADAGASCVVVQRGADYDPSLLPEIIVEDTRIALGKMSSNFFGKPSNSLAMFGVTGTNGKTTTTYMLSSILEAAGKPAGRIGTISYKAGNQVYESTNTTPESYELHMMFSEMREAGDKACTMEVSSHALYMNRVSGITFDYSIFTNLTEDHLDFHKDFEDYYQAKKKLFFLTWGGSIINIDDEYGQRMYDELKEEGVRVYSFSKRDDEADYFAEVTQETDTFSVIKVYNKGSYVAGMRIGIPGEFSVYNALGAFAAAYESGIEAEDIVRGIESLKGVPGRFELVPNDKGVVAIVDYAHTPDALIKVLDTANQFKKGRLICVFGCGGDRDRAKRPMMGKAAGERCEYCIVTSDNPRTEDPDLILKDIEPGIAETSCPFEMIVDRKEGIKRAIDIYEPGDVILVAGKGHEDYQIIGKTKYHFDDKEVITEILNG